MSPEKAGGAKLKMFAPTKEDKMKKALKALLLLNEDLIGVQREFKELKAIASIASLNMNNTLKELDMITRYVTNLITQKEAMEGDCIREEDC